MRTTVSDTAFRRRYRLVRQNMLDPEPRRKSVPWIENVCNESEYSLCKGKHIDLSIDMLRITTRQKFEYAW